MIHGLLAVNKPSGVTSHDVVETVRRLFKMKKVGHFGTLDPLASGLLLIGLGNATKFFDFYMKKKKVYSGKIRFGYATTTYDAEGDPLSEPKGVDLGTVDIDALLAAFTGKQMQLPPLYSAKKYKGKPMYMYAREHKTEEVARKPVPVEVYRLEGRMVDPCTLWFRAETSSGTYIRSLAHDMGEKLGVGAHLHELKREQVGDFLLDHAFTPEAIADLLASGKTGELITPIEALLPEFPRIIVTPNARNAILNGQALMPGDVLKIITGENNDHFRIFDDQGQLLAMASKDPHLMRFNPYLVFNHA
ncbi:MAG: tRNA pseudouridine(55) synthase TruB [Candidatus Omnitrophota bacterium]